MKLKSTLPSLFLLLALLFMASHGHAQTAFTYQGQLRDGSTNANGNYSLTFKLFDNAGGGTQIGSTLTVPNQSVVNGLFTVALDFGGAAFDGNARWLEITVKAGASAAETLAPRVAVLPSPYALYAKVAGTVTNGAIMNAQLAASAIATANIQNGAITTALIANGAVTDGKIATVSGAKVSGSVASAIFATSAGSATTAGFATNAGTAITAGFATNAGFATSAFTAGFAATAALANSVTNGAIVTGSLQDAAVTTGKMQDAAVTTGKIVDKAVTGAKIADGQVVKTLNGLTDVVTFSAGANVTLSTTGDNIRISAALTNIGPWTIGVGPYTIPGDNTYPDALTFANFGAIRMAIIEPGVFITGGLGVAGDITVKGQLEATIISPGVVNGRIDLDGSLDVKGGITALGEITALGIMSAPAFNQTSDRNAKENFAPVDARVVLERVVGLPISNWNFKTDRATRHIGPMAQDFHAAFMLGTDDKHIATVDEGGVALAAIQGLHSIVREKVTEIADLKKRLETLERIVLKQNGGGQ